MRSGRLSGYDALPSATDAVILFANIALFRYIFLTDQPAWLYTFVFPFIAAIINALAAYHALRQKKQLHELPSQEVPDILPSSSDMDVLTFEQQKEKTEWEEQIEKYALDEEMHTGEGIRGTALLIFLGYLICGLIVGLPMMFMEDYVPRVFMIAIGLLITLSYFTARITQRRLLWVFLRSLILMLALAGGQWMLQRIFQ